MHGGIRSQTKHGFAIGEYKRHDLDKIRILMSRAMIRKDVLVSVKFLTGIETYKPVHLKTFRIAGRIARATRQNKQAKYPDSGIKGSWQAI